MLKKRMLLLLVVGGALVLVGLAWFSRGPEPEYGGKKLSEWVETLGRHPLTQDEVCSEAIRQIGSNAIPSLLKWIRYEPPAWRKRFGELCSFFGLESSRRGDFLASGATMAFGRLGPQGAGAVRELSQLLNDPEAGSGAARAADALSDLKEAGLLALVASLTNPDVERRRIIVSQIGSMGVAARPALPELVKLLGDPDVGVQETVTNAIWWIDHRALEPAAPRAHERH